MKNIGVFLSENLQFLEVKFSIYLNRRVFVMVISLPYLSYTLNKASTLLGKPIFSYEMTMDV